MCRHAALGLDALKNVFHQMSFPVGFPISPSAAGSVGMWLSAGQTAVAPDDLMKFVRVAAFVPYKDNCLGQKRQEAFAGFRLSALTGEEEESHDVTSFMIALGELRVMPAFGEPNRLSLIAFDCSLASLVDFYEGVVEKPCFPFGFRVRRPRTSVQSPTTPSGAGSGKLCSKEQFAAEDRSNDIPPRNEEKSCLEEIIGRERWFSDIV